MKQIIITLDEDARLVGFDFGGLEFHQVFGLLECAKQSVLSEYAEGRKEVQKAPKKRTTKAKRPRKV
jgi:hypothetical protein